MSGVVKGVKKTFKTVAKTVKKVAKPLLMAAAIYFTAGLALSAFPTTAAFASAMPGFAGGGFLRTGIGVGKAAGTGVFTKIAAKFGMATLGKAGGLAGGALAKGTTVAALQTSIGAKTTATGIAKGVASGAVSGATAVTPAVATALGSTANQALFAGGAQTGVGGNVAAAAGGMSLSEKLLMASTTSQFASGLLAPTPREVEESRTRWVGSFYGDEGAGALIPTPLNPMDPRAASAQGAARPQMSAAAPQRRVPADVQAMRARAPTQPQDTVDRSYDYGGDSLIPSARDPFEATAQ